MLCCISELKAFPHLSQTQFLQSSMWFILSESVAAQTLWLIHCGMVKAYSHTHGERARESERASERVRERGLCLQWKPRRHGISFHIQLRPKKHCEKSTEKISCKDTHTLKTNISVCIYIKPASYTNISSPNKC